MLLLFFLLRSLLSKLYLTTLLQLSRREMILERNATDGLLGWKGWLTGYGWAVLGIMITDYGSTHDGRKEIDLFILSC
jgi:hypothetical protein